MMAKYFVGFGSFNCAKLIWKPIEKIITRKELAWRLSSIKNGKGNTLDSGYFRNMHTGAKDWGTYGDRIVAYSNDADLYNKRWNIGLSKEDRKKTIFVRGETLELFKTFQESIPPEEKCEEKHKKFLAPAKKVCEYLSEVERYFALPLSEHDETWLNAGMYVLICLFVQNRDSSRTYDPPRFVEPPGKYSLNNLRKLIANNGEEPKEEELSKQPVYKEADVEFHSPELETLPFDLLAQAKAFFEKKGEHSRNTPFDPVITPAEVRRKRVPYSKTHTVGEVFSTYRTGVFLYEDFLIGEESDVDTEYLGHKARFVPSTTNGINRIFRLEGTCFEDETMDAYELKVEDRAEGFYIFPLRFDDHAVGPMFVEDAFRIDIDGYGYPRNHSVDRLMKSYQIQEEVQPYSTLRRYAIPLRREYLNYQIINAETMEVLPMQHSRDQQGQEQLNVVIPSPCKLVILKNEPTALTVEERLLLYIRGYLHGLYGLKKSLFQAMLEIKAGLYHLDRQHAHQCAFQYGVYLRTQGNAAAEDYLRRAAEDIPGARFELATLLLEQDHCSPEAEALLDGLWAEGYRYYGLTSIDLMNKHPS